MKKIRGKFWAKAMALVLLTVCALVFAGSVGGIIILADWTDVRNGDEDDMLSEAYQIVSVRYATTALANYLDGRTYVDLSELGFRYGIIKAEEISNVDLTDLHSYAYSTFASEDLEALNPDACFVMSRQVPANSDLYVTNVHTSFWGTYCTIMNAVAAPEYTEDVSTEVDVALKSNTVEVTMGRAGDGNAASDIDTGGVTDSDDADEAEEGTAFDTYWVVSVVPSDLPGSWRGDMFDRVTALIRMAYALRYSIFIILPGSFVACVLLLVFLFSASGYRGSSDTVTAGWFEHVPTDIALVVTAIVEILLFLAAKNMFHFIGLAGIMLGAFFILCMGWVGLFFLLSLAARVKLRNFWRNSAIYEIGVRLRRFVGMIVEPFEKKSILVKAAACIIVVTLIEFCTFVAPFFLRTWRWWWTGRAVCAIWLIETVVLAVFALWAFAQMKKLQTGGRHIAAGELDYQIDTHGLIGDFKRHAEDLNGIGQGMQRAVDERMKSERFKTELITNVSHDIKTPLTSIINYVDLLQKEPCENGASREYIDVISRQSDRLKKLIEDLIEASKASTGSLSVRMETLDAGVILSQLQGEFAERLERDQLTLVVTKSDEPVWITADGRHLWRVLDNLMVNICKYAQPATRVYISLEEADGRAVLTFRNVSKYPLNISGEELLERFVRGDASRHTEGTGLGLSIAKSLMELMHGTFDLVVDGDLFKVVLALPCADATRE